jgi:GTP-binding protein
MHILKATYVISSPAIEKCPPARYPEFAFIGRSNVGKSSLINMLCNHQGLAKTSASPGKTQYINHFLVESFSSNQQKNKTLWYIVDLPGYGYAKTAQSNRRSWQKMISNYLQQRTNLVNTFVLIDSRHPPQSIDMAFIDQLGKWQLPFSIVFTKADKEKPGVVKRNIENFKEKLLETWQFLPRQFITSATTKQGREEILIFIDSCNESFLLPK